MPLGSHGNNISLGSTKTQICFVVETPSKHIFCFEPSSVRLGLHAGNRYVFVGSMGEQSFSLMKSHAKTSFKVSSLSRPLKYLTDARN